MAQYGLKIDLPEWLKKLPPGEYTLDGLSKSVKTACKANIYMRLQGLNVERVKKRKETDTKMIFYYAWKGANYYYLRAYEKNLKKVWG